MTSEPRILLMAETYHPVLGGGEKHTRTLALGLARLGFTVNVITRQSSADLQTREDDGGVAIYRVGSPGKGRGKKFGMVPSAYRLARALAAESEVLMNGGTRVLALPARLAVSGARCALVLRPELNGELDGSLALWSRESRELDRGLVYLLARFRNFLLRRTGAVVAISEEIAREAVRAGFPREKVHLIPHGIDMSEYTPVDAAKRAALRATLGLPADKLLVTYTGRLIEGKGLETLFAAIKSLADVPSLHLVLVGSGQGQVISVEEKLREQAASPELAGRITFTGRVENVAAWLQASDIFAFPTLDEALGMSAVEAQACGLPAVASRTGGVPDIIEDGVTGILVPPGEAGPLAQGLRKLIEDGPLRANYAEAARNRAKQKFAIEVTVAKYADLFRSLAAKERPA